jgi:hypothetical protein
MTQIHYFPRYSQRENFETNNTLLLLHRLYNYNRFRFERFLSKLLREAATEAGGALELGLQIKQQVGTGTSIVDGYLYQDSLRIAIEAKRSADSFRFDQLSRHLSGFTQSNGGFLILLSPERAQIENPGWANIAAEARAKNVILVPVTFENVIAAARECLNDYDEEMHALIVDYEDFCSNENLLPVDKWTLFVPPCGRSHQIVTRQKLYFCPSSWSRRKARYLGVYYNKAVRHIGRISKVVECEMKDEIVISETVPLSNDEHNRIVAASREHQTSGDVGDLRSGHQFFLCDDMRETMFEKSSPGGIPGHRYFDLRQYFSGNLPLQLQEIGDHLRSKQWE